MADEKIILDDNLIGYIPLETRNPDGMQSMFDRKVKILIQNFSLPYKVVLNFKVILFENDMPYINRGLVCEWFPEPLIIDDTTPVNNYGQYIYNSLGEFDSYLLNKEGTEYLLDKEQNRIPKYLIDEDGRITWPDKGIGEYTFMRNYYQNDGGMKSLIDGGIARACALGRCDLKL